MKRSNKKCLGLSPITISGSRSLHWCSTRRFPAYACPSSNPVCFGIRLLNCSAQLCCPKLVPEHSHPTTAAYQHWDLSHQRKYCSFTQSLLTSHLLLPAGVISLIAWPSCPPCQIFPRSPVTIVKQLHPISTISINLYKSYFFVGDNTYFTYHYQILFKIIPKIYFKKKKNSRNLIVIFFPPNITGYFSVQRHYFTKWLKKKKQKQHQGLLHL